MVPPSHREGSCRLSLRRVLRCSGEGGEIVCCWRVKMDLPQAQAAFDHAMHTLSMTSTPFKNCFFFFLFGTFHGPLGPRGLKRQPIRRFHKQLAF